MLKGKIYVTVSHYPAMFRYLVHLPPQMVVGKARHTLTTRLLVPRAAGKSAPDGYPWSVVLHDPRVAAFAAVFRANGDRFAPTCELLHEGEFKSNGVSHLFGSPSAVTWGHELDEPRFMRWQHDLAYFFFSIPLISADSSRGISTIASMIEALELQRESDPAELRKFHWSPIAVASRILALSTALALAPTEALEDNRQEVIVIGEHLWRLGEILKYSVERYLGFNHAAITETALAVVSLLKGRVKQSQRSICKSVGILEAGTLRDGMWAERSPSYHIHMLVLVEALKAMLQDNAWYSSRLGRLSDKMRLALAAVVHPDGEIGIFNDSAVADAPAPSSIDWNGATVQPKMVLPDAGYARLSKAETVVIMDAGAMGPDAAIGHGHADFLSVEVSIGRNRFIVDPGVASVAPGSDRIWTRSAASHNGPTLEGAEPAEFFGTWRVGRRGKAWFEYPAVEEGACAISVSGICDGYMPWGVMVSRRLVLEASGRLTIKDKWIGDDLDRATVSFLVPSGWIVHKKSGTDLHAQHPDGITVNISILNGFVEALDKSRCFVEGPMHEEGATRIVIKPVDGLATTSIQACD